MVFKITIEEKNLTKKNLINIYLNIISIRNFKHIHDRPETTAIQGVTTTWASKEAHLEGHEHFNNLIVFFLFVNGLAGILKSQ